MRPFLAVAVLLEIMAAGGAQPQDPSARIAASQVTLQLDRIRGRATVIGVEADKLSVVTAAHFLSDEHEGRIILVRRGDDLLAGRILSVVQNPYFHMARSTHAQERPLPSGTLGVDTAVAIIRTRVTSEVQRRFLGTIQPVDWTDAPIPRGASQVLSVHIVDQHDREHVVRAGNHLNPKCLAWGRSRYDPQHGDSGAGVFVVRKSPRGTARPILIGNVSQTDDRGGIASLAHRGDGWVESAFSRAVEAPTGGQ